jgi:prolipoprotein diacylglyceryltransferase
VRPFLFATDQFTVGAYPVMILCAAIAAIATLAWRTRNRSDIDHAVLFRTLPIAIAAGWVLSALVLSLPDGFSLDAFLANLAPTTRSGQTVTFFGAGAGIVALMMLLPQRRNALRYLDALAPSFPIGLAFAKTGCFLAGCCAGTLCQMPVGITFPFGSDAYTAQWHKDKVSPPEAVIYQPEHKPPRLLGHAQALETASHAPNELLLAHTAKHDQSVDDLSELASSLRSLPVWPVQPAYIFGALILWIVAERFFQRAPFDGAAACAVTVGYGVIRIGIDFFVEGLEPIALGLTVPQWSGVAALVVGSALGLAGSMTNARAARPRTPHTPA